MSDTEIPEGCRLVAHWTGEGWQLSVVDRKGKTVAYLGWPSGWPIMLAEELMAHGFQIV